MVIRKGYKQTELGIIPEDWEVVPLSSIASIERGKFTHRPRNDPAFYGGKYPFIQTGDVESSNGKITKITQTLNEKGLSVSKLFPKRIIVVTIAANIGSTAITTFPVCFPDSLIGIIPNNMNTEFLEYFLRTKKGYLNKTATNSAQKNINLETLKPLLIIKPDNDEQQKISSTISDIEKLIHSLESLIQKKKNIKQGTMQELLTGKRRLEGFSGEWEIKQLGKIINIEKGEQLNKSNLTLKDLYAVWNGGMEPSGFTNKYNQEENIITISEGGNSCGYVNFSFKKFWAGAHCYILNTPKPDLDKIFLFYALKYSEKSIMKLRVGSGLPNIQKKRISQFEISLPPTKEEQEAISKILSDMDSEIQQLENQLNKYINLKQAMMQKLLTGEIRLV